MAYEEFHHRAFTLASPMPLVGALALILFAYFLQMAAWVAILRYLGISPEPLKVFQGYWLSFLPRYIPGSVWGYWSRSQWLEQSCGIGYGTSVLASILETLALILTALSMSGLYLGTRLVGVGRPLLVAASLGLMLLTCLVIPRFVIQFVEVVIPRFMRRLGKEGVWQVGAEDGTLLRPWLLSVIFYLAIWMIYGGSILLITVAVQPSFPSSGLLGTTFSVSLSWFLGFIVIFVPMGIGVREFALSALLKSQFGLLPQQGNFVAVLFRLGVILSELVWLIVGLSISVVARCGGATRRALHSRQSRG